MRPDPAEAALEPLSYVFEVACAPEHAFRSWTASIASWWPADHTVSGERDVTVILEPGLGGRLLERTASGVEHEWGTITEWDPPSRLAYQWYIRRDRADATDVRIAFTPAGPDRTRIEIVHDGWERLGDGSAWRERNTGGWEGVIPPFIAFASSDLQEGTH